MANMHALTRKKRRPKQCGSKKRGLIKALTDALHTGDQSLATQQGAGNIGIMMLLRAKRLRKWLLWLKRRRLGLKRRLKNLEILENLLKEERALAKECAMTFRMIAEPADRQAVDHRDYPLNAQEITALLAAFPQNISKHLPDFKHSSGPMAGPPFRQGGKKTPPAS